MMVKYEDRVRKTGFQPRKIDAELNDNIQAIKDLHYNKIQKVKTRVSAKVKILSELGVSKCLCCKTDIGLNTKQFIAFVTCIECFDNPTTLIGRVLRETWSNKE